MQELTQTLWACTKCNRLFAGIPMPGGGLPCGHTYEVAATAQEVTRSMRIALEVEVRIAEKDSIDFDLQDFVEGLEELVND
ncbi:MAG: hypothetical protein KUA35_09230 [Pseudodesulfovibrio sp.]|uniref:Uncharacterized protein n=1 Tax=Pseudodesulfovibrio aespoeensis (strain ATCC 700646 / DSM 10631 / Aspo-2) TaxID=643562 RepID=E6VX43_PSEA9|nr:MULTISPECIES: hypothetical protein [Pseudodesulfovibrio]MBU4378873.1 hypothetical protein [Pseudomonadota bacterium]MCG2741998.1 hypothetical protein [Syntrophaceae bacterium]ADU61449.1 hypothetical protein Daes_0425 [Pseudodesulfovibrio aespoeensis Aspo-2]MBU4475251.1 hypothetical protein [Pseudomonadota bacterium]MBU4516289.1 hypothetical protein [Pseudomonadota bacterium]